MTRRILKVSKKMNPGDGLSEKSKDLTIRSSVTCKDDIPSETTARMGSSTAIDPKDTTVLSANTTDVSSQESKATAVAPANVDKIAPDVVETRDERLRRNTNRNSQLSRRCDRLLLRLRQLQVQQTVTHARNQVSGLIAHHRCQSVNSIVGDVSTKAPPAAEGSSSQSTLDLKDAQNLSTSALVSLVQRWQAQNSPARATTECGDVIQLEDGVCNELESVSGHLKSNVEHLQRCVDSDATDSSSGKENAHSHFPITATPA